MPVLDKAGHQTNKEYLWMVRAVVERLVLFHYDKGSRAGAVIAKDFKANSNVRLVNCMMTHIRRSFEKSLAENKQPAEHVLKEIQLLYRIEHDCDRKQFTQDERMKKRQELAKPIMYALKLWMETKINAGILEKGDAAIFR